MAIHSQILVKIRQAVWPVTRMDGQTARLILTKISEWKAIYHGGNIGGRYSPNNPLRGRPHGVGLRKFKCVCVWSIRVTHTDTSVELHVDDPLEDCWVSNDPPYVTPRVNGYPFPSFGQDPASRLAVHSCYTHTDTLEFSKSNSMWTTP